MNHDDDAHDAHGAQHLQYRPWRGRDADVAHGPAHPNPPDLPEPQELYGDQEGPGGTEAGPRRTQKQHGCAASLDERRSDVIGRDVTDAHGFPEAATLEIHLDAEERAERPLAQQKVRDGGAGGEGGRRVGSGGRGLWAGYGRSWASALGQSPRVFLTLDIRTPEGQNTSG